MLDLAQKFEKVFDAFGDVDLYYKTELMTEDEVLEKKDWEIVRRLCLFCKKFMNSQSNFQDLLISPLTIFLMMFVMFMSLCVIDKQILMFTCKQWQKNKNER